MTGPVPDQGDPCTNTTYGEICEEDEFDGSYPEDLVKSLIKKSNTLKSPVHFNKLFERPCDYEPIVTQFRVIRWQEKEPKEKCLMLPGTILSYSCTTFRSVALKKTLCANPHKNTFFQKLPRRFEDNGDTS